MSSREEILERHNFVIDLVLRRFRKNLIWWAWKQQFPDVTSRATFNKDYREAKAWIRNHVSGTKKEQRFAEAVMAREQLAQIALEKGKLDTALSAEKDLAKLENLYPEADKKDADVHVSFDFGELPMAPDDIEPVSEEMLEDYDKAAEE